MKFKKIQQVFPFGAAGGLGIIVLCTDGTLWLHKGMHGWEELHGPREPEDETPGEILDELRSSGAV